MPPPFFTKARSSASITKCSCPTTASSTRTATSPSARTRHRVWEVGGTQVGCRSARTSGSLMALRGIRPQPVPRSCSTSMPPRSQGQGREREEMYRRPGRARGGGGGLSQPGRRPGRARFRRRSLVTWPRRHDRPPLSPVRGGHVRRRCAAARGGGGGRLVTDHLEPVEEVYRALETGLGDYVRKNGFEQVVIGLSGGIDSALRRHRHRRPRADSVLGVAMPSVSPRTTPSRMHAAGGQSGCVSNSFRSTTRSGLFSMPLPRCSQKRSSARARRTSRPDTGGDADGNLEQTRPDGWWPRGTSRKWLSGTPPSTATWSGVTRSSRTCSKPLAARPGPMAEQVRRCDPPEHHRQAAIGRIATGPEGF